MPPQTPPTPDYLERLRERLIATGLAARNYNKEIEAVINRTGALTVQIFGASDALKAYIDFSADLVKSITDQKELFAYFSRSIAELQTIVKILDLTQTEYSAAVDTLIRRLAIASPLATAYYGELRKMAEAAKTVKIEKEHLAITLTRVVTQILEAAGASDVLKARAAALLPHLSAVQREHLAIALTMGESLLQIIRTNPELQKNRQFMEQVAGSYLQSVTNLKALSLSQKESRGFLERFSSSLRWKGALLRGTVSSYEDLLERLANFRQHIRDAVISTGQMVSSMVGVTIQANTFSGAIRAICQAIIVGFPIALAHIRELIRAGMLQLLALMVPGFRSTQAYIAGMQKFGESAKVARPAFEALYGILRGLGGALMKATFGLGILAGAFVFALSQADRYRKMAAELLPTIFSLTLAQEGASAQSIDLWKVIRDGIGIVRRLSERLIAGLPVHYRFAAYVELMKIAQEAFGMATRETTFMIANMETVTTQTGQTIRRMASDVGVSALQIAEGLTRAALLSRLFAGETSYGVKLVIDIYRHFNTRMNESLENMVRMYRQAINARMHFKELVPVITENFKNLSLYNIGLRETIHLFGGFAQALRAAGAPIAITHTIMSDFMRAVFQPFPRLLAEALAATGARTPEEAFRAIRGQLLATEPGLGLLRMRIQHMRQILERFGLLRHGELADLRAILFMSQFWQISPLTLMRFEKQILELLQTENITLEESMNMETQMRMLEDQSLRILVDQKSILERILGTIQGGFAMIADAFAKAFLLSEESRFLIREGMYREEPARQAIAITQATMVAPLAPLEGELRRAR